MRRWLTAVALGALWSEAARANGPRPEDVKVGLLLGGEVSLATEADVAVAPRAGIDVELPLTGWNNGPRLHAGVALKSLAGETLSLETPSTFRAIEVKLAGCQPVHPSVYIDLCLEGGFATRLEDDPGPRDKAVRWASGGVRFGRVGKGWLTLGLGRDQRLDGLYRWAVTMAGAIKMHEIGKTSLQLFGDAILGMDSGVGAPRRDVVRVGVAVGR